MQAKRGLDFSFKCPELRFFDEAAIKIARECRVVYFGACFRTPDERGKDENQL